MIVIMWLVLYDINYIYRRKTPRFVDYDEVEAGKIKQSLTFHLNDINYIFRWMTPIFVDYDEVEAAFHSGGKIRTLLYLFTFFDGQLLVISTCSGRPG